MSTPAEDPTPARGRPRRLGTFAVDQAIAGASNVLAAVLAATTLDGAGFGKFGLVFISFVVCQSIARALVAEPLLVHPDEAGEDPGEALSAAIAVGLGIGALVVLAGAITIARLDADTGLALVLLGGAFPLLTLQDTGRYVAFATRNPGAAIELDLVWLVLMVAGIVTAGLVTDLALPGLVLGWVAAGSAGGLLALHRHRGRRFRPTLAWVRRCWPFSWRYVVSATIRQGGALAGAVLLAAVVSVAAVGAVQGALLAFRPLSTVQIAATTAGTAEVARDGLEGRVLRRFALSLAGATVVAAVVNTAVLMALPTALGELFLGETWSATEELLLPAGLTAVAMAFWTGAWAGLQGNRAVREIVALDLGVVPVLVAVAIVGAALGGVEGYYWGVVAGNVVVTSATWLVFLRHTRTPGARALGSTEADAAMLPPS